MSQTHVRAGVRITALMAVGAIAWAGDAGLRAERRSPARSAPGPCSSAEHRQFDFWLGEWEVRTPDGKLAGRNTIRRTLDGCVLYESWRGARGHAGNSFNIYDASRRRWHQTWVDDEGLLLQLDGGFTGGKMVLTGATVDSSGRTVGQRITWAPLDGGRVRQLWESSQGGAWAVVFDGIYSPVNRGRSPS